MNRPELLSEEAWGVGDGRIAMKVTLTFGQLAFALGSPSGWRLGRLVREVRRSVIGLPLGELFAVASAEALAGASEQTSVRLGQDMARFARFVTVGHELSAVAEITAEIAEAFCSAPDRFGRYPSESTRSNRRTAIRLLFIVFRRFGLAANDPTLDIPIDRAAGESVRPLVDAEVERCERFAGAGLLPTHGGVVLALSQSTASTAELAAIRVADVDVVSGTVRLRGGSKLRPRIGLLTPFGKAHLAEWVSHCGLSDGDLIAYSGAGSAGAPQAAMSTALRTLLDRSGVSHARGTRGGAVRGEVGPSSIRAWAGRKVLIETGQIESAARALGCVSLDTAARIVQFDWDPA